MREVAEKGREERGKEGSRVEKRRRTGRRRGGGMEKSEGQRGLGGAFQSFFPSPAASELWSKVPPSYPISSTHLRPLPASLERMLSQRSRGPASLAHSFVLRLNMDLSSSFPFSGMPCPSLPSLVFQHLAQGDSSLGFPELHTSAVPHPRQEGEEGRQQEGRKDGILENSSPVRSKASNLESALQPWDPSTEKTFIKDF